MKVGKAEEHSRLREQTGVASTKHLWEWWLIYGKKRKEENRMRSHWKQIELTGWGGRNWQEGRGECLEQSGQSKLKSKGRGVCSSDWFGLPGAQCWSPSAERREAAGTEVMRSQSGKVLCWISCLDMPWRFQEEEQRDAEFFPNLEGPRPCFL